MSDLKQKFVFTKDLHFEMGRVKFHRELDPNALGGGYWFIDLERKVAYLYSTSYDFGKCKPEWINNELDFIKERFHGAEVKFEEDEDVELYEILCRDMDNLRAMDLISENDWV